ncbi:plasmid mobilization relaxosome protein MobC [Kingella kingae]|uniref:plasmid mobilization relaxosome protein MobC n=1 Tax=Kingella kingae TaxID=504 RepID=UPI0006920512|nr:plasmid mobilization relaxosome protein MobC [Kingella kingae]MDK4526734.1 plasmid mobilization relaxosome protein MobC [Kingella kingae]MDK4532761.1 plasmid mobilization relaxosome protein MobC [Kingella kingae]
MKQIKVYGISDFTYAELEKISQSKFGKANVSHLARNLLLNELAQNPVVPHPLSHQTAKKRLELKLPPHIATYLQETAQQGAISPNQLAIAIIQSHMDNTPVLTNKEINALYQSNFQLLSIGRNLNQIARQLNGFEPASLTSQYIMNLHQFIQNHVEEVSHIIMHHRRKRQEKPK